MTTNPYAFTYCAATDDSVYVVGVVSELEDQDVNHAIFWERIAGEWCRYKWNNRCHGLATYTEASRPSAAYLGYEGTLKVRSQVTGSRVEVLETGPDTPSSLRSVSCIREIDNHLFVVGMRRMVYRRSLTDTQWHRWDAGLRLPLADDAIAGLRSIDGASSTQLVAVGLEGEIWIYSDGCWAQDSSPTTSRLAAIRHVGEGRYVIGGAEGTLLVGTPGQWRMVTHGFENHTFRCIEQWDGRCFICSDNEELFELHLGQEPSLEQPPSPQPKVNWISATADRAYFLSRDSLWSLSADGWQDESPPAALLQYQAGAS
jgi:hypothetical protein